MKGGRGGMGRGVEGWGVGGMKNTAVSKILHLPDLHFDQKLEKPL